MNRRSDRRPALASPRQSGRPRRRGGQLHSIKEQLRAAGSGGAHYVPGLIGRLGSPGRRRHAAAALLGTIGSPVADGAVGNLIECLRDDPAPEKIGVALRRLRITGVDVDALIAVLEDEGRARYEAAQLLGRVGWPIAEAAVTPMVECMLDDPEPLRLASAIRGFGFEAGPALAPVIEALERDEGPTAHQVAVLSRAFPPGFPP